MDGCLDITSLTDRDLRHCRTRALVARLFAGRPRHPSNSGVWEFVARAWEELASLKEDDARLDARAARLAAELGPWRAARS